MQISLSKKKYIISSITSCLKPSIVTYSRWDCVNVYIYNVAVSLRPNLTRKVKIIWLRRSTLTYAMISWSCWSQVWLGNPNWPMFNHLVITRKGRYELPTCVLCTPSNVATPGRLASPHAWVKKDFFPYSFECTGVISIKLP